MNALIADDEHIARQILREHAETIPALEIVGEAASGPEALERILDLKPDLVFLDLEMPEMTGLNVVRHLRGAAAPLIIFVTAYQQHALEAFDVGAVDYLLKPVRRERLTAAVEKARRQLEGFRAARRPGAKPTSGLTAALPGELTSGLPADLAAGPASGLASAPASGLAAGPASGLAAGPAAGKIVGRRGADLYFLDPSEIVAFEADRELVHIITTGQRYLCDHSLKAMEEKLAGSRFRRIHRRTLINTDLIRKISRLSSKRWLLRMSNGFEAVVSKRQAGLIREHAGGHR
ncbi:MAG TPA: LytTR family DNA-binding domain-containing protein [Bryobacteraceae bacterium]|nr:LytTR family DNA-binding domain-containing protein [Bryobacteraceae bacterium]